MNVNIKLSVDLFPCISQIIGLMVCMGMIRGMNSLFKLSSDNDEE
jgi:hypothetical protein